MRFALTILRILAMAAFPAGIALATDYDEICFDNLNNTSSSPTATSNGLLWINTGSGPVKLAQDVNLELLGVASASATPITPTADCYQLSNGHPAKLLLSVPSGGVGSAVGDYTFWDTPGQFLDSSADAGSAYAVPGSYGILAYSYFQLLAWTGDYSSYIVAKAAGQYVAQSTVFENFRKLRWTL